MLGARTAGLGLALGLASFALVDNTMFIGRYCEPVMMVMVMIMMVMMMTVMIMMTMMMMVMMMMVMMMKKGLDGFGKPSPMYSPSISSLISSTSSSS